MKTKSPYWVKLVQNGLIGGFISILLGVVGLALAFGKTYVISGVITMAVIIILAPVLFESLLSVKNAPSKEPVQLLIAGGLTGLVAGALIAAFVLIDQVVNLRSVLINVSPDLINLLIFGLPIAVGVIVLILACLVVGLIGASLSSSRRGSAAP